MYAFLITALTVCAAEIGDKTQLLAIILASRFKKPVPILWGILAATLLNHVIAGLIGEWFGSQLEGKTLYAILGCMFLLAAIWIMIPDKLESKEIPIVNQRSIFMTTFIVFFIAEIGDKTQIATAILAAEYQSLLPVVLGSTVGMLLANVPAVLLANKAVQYIPIKAMRLISACIFIGLAITEFIKLFA